MNKLALLLLLFPIVAIANDFEPFKTVRSNQNNITLIFKDTGTKFSAIYKSNRFITSYGQKLDINVGDTLTLSAKHTKYIVTAISIKQLNVQYKHNFQGKRDSNSYAINFK